MKNHTIHCADPSTEFDDEPSLGHCMLKSLTEAGDRTMLVSAETGEKLSAADLVKECVKMAKVLIAAGIRQGDVVSIVSESRFEYAFAMFATIFLNCKFAPINHTFSEREIEHALKLSRPKAIFASSATKEKVLRVAESLSFLEKVLLLDKDISNDKKTFNLCDLTNSDTLRRVKFELQAVDKSKTVCFIMCSSGTTGLPKGVQITQSNIIVTTRHFTSNLLNKQRLGTNEVTVLGLLPLFHVFGAVLLTCSMTAACAKIVLLSKFEPRTFLKSIQDYCCSVLFAVPPLVVFLAKNELVDNFDLSSLRLLFCGAAPLSKEVEQAVKDRLKNPKLIVKQGYGMTELTFGVLAQKKIIKPGSVGDLNFGVSGKVVDENGNAVGPHERGELCFKGSVLMLGYINDESATSGTIDKDGWLHSGDVGYYDEDFQFYIVDRIKELIKWKGFQVPPAGTWEESLELKK